MSVDPIFWLLAAIGFVVLEAMTLNLVSIWFAVGSAAALLSCLVTGSFRVQAVVFPPRRHPAPGPELPGGRDPQPPAHRGAHPHRDRRTGGSLI